jgi:hypothetical protein
MDGGTTLLPVEPHWVFGQHYISLDLSCSQICRRRSAQLLVAIEGFWICLMQLPIYDEPAPGKESSIGKNLPLASLPGVWKTLRELPCSSFPQVHCATIYGPESVEILGVILLQPSRTRSMNGSRGIPLAIHSIVVWFLIRPTVLV